VSGQVEAQEGEQHVETQQAGTQQAGTQQAGTQQAGTQQRDAADFVTEVSVDLADADATRAYGAALAGLLRAGDLVVLTGDLGAGKTTLTQGIGSGLHVRGAVASPTFVIARVHPPLPRPDGSAGPTLVHVDAYRLGSLDEVDALDLDASLDEAVTVVEWGEGLVESLADDRLEVALRRPRGEQASLDEDADAAAGVRTVTVRARGDRWRGVALPV
jgi:tRNA threonylcarbamoyladenosine biosynthesis protein TsaE